MTQGIVITRRLGVLENFYRSRTASKFYRNFQVTATYSNDLTADPNLIYKALRKTLLDYHILICNIFKRDDMGYSVYRPITEAKLRDLVEFQEESFGLDKNGIVTETFMKYVNENYIFELYEEKPLFKLIILGGYHVCVSLEHTIADGVVGRYFHEILLENLAFADNPDNDAIFHTDYGFDGKSSISLDSIIFNFEHDEQYIKNSLPPAIDGFLEDIDLDYAYGDLNHFSKVKPSGQMSKWPGRFPATTKYSLSFKLIHFTPSEVSNILTKCRERSVTLTSFLEVVFAHTLRPIIGENHYSQTKVAVTLRRFLDPELADPEYKAILKEPSHKILGTYAHGGIEQMLPPVKEFSWDLVKNVNANLLTVISNNRLLNLQKPFRDVADELNDNKFVFEQAIGKPKADTVKISNIGLASSKTFEIKDKPTWAITNMIFSQDVQGSAADFQVNVISTSIGGLNIVLSYHDHTFDDSPFNNFDHLQQDLKSNILANIK